MIIILISISKLTSLCLLLIVAFFLLLFCCAQGIEWWCSMILNKVFMYVFVHSFGSICANKYFHYYTRTSACEEVKLNIWWEARMQQLRSFSFLWKLKPDLLSNFHFVFFLWRVNCRMCVCVWRFWNSRFFNLKSNGIRSILFVGTIRLCIK